MTVKMKIVRVHADQHSVVVRYFSDKITEKMLASDARLMADGSPENCRTDRNVSIHDVPAPTGEALTRYIFKVSPPDYGEFALWEKIADPGVNTSMAGIQVGVVVDVPEAAPPPEFPDPRHTEVFQSREKAVKTTIL